MRSLCAALLVLLAYSAGPAQELPKVNFVELYGQVPAPPADAREAYARCELPRDSHSLAVDPAKYYQPMAEKFEGLSKKLEGISLQLSKPEADKMADKMKGMDAKEMQKKMQSMSQAEKVKFAMEMSQQMGLGQKALTPEPARVNDALQEYSSATGEMSKDIQNAGEQMQTQAKMQEDHEKKHKDVEDWRITEEAKIPLLSSGEMSYREPKALRALMLKTADKHVAVENEHLKNVRAAYQAELDKWKKRYTPLQQKMIAINYGNDARNVETKKILVGGDGLMLGVVGNLLGISKDATKSAADWYARKLKVESEKDQ